MNYYIKIPLIALSLLLFLPSCSHKKLKALERSNTSLRRQNTELQSDVTSLKSRLQLMEDANESAADELDEKERLLNDNQETLAEQQARLQQLQDMIDRQRAATEALRQKMAGALGNFSSDQLQVSTKNGKVYVSLAEKLLFPSGSAEVNEDGKKALAQLAAALNENKDINVNIEGHTDTVPIRIKFPDNWALSVARSTAIVRMLTEDYQVDPVRVTASGRSQYEPVADNTTEEGRAANRRTEIILSPKLDELMKLIGESR